VRRAFLSMELYETEVLSRFLLVEEILDDSRTTRRSTVEPVLDA